MNTILQKRIEEAAKESVLEEIPPYIPSDFVNDSELECAYERAQEIFISGANFALQNQWISVEEALPEKSGDYLVIVRESSYGEAYFNEISTYNATDNIWYYVGKLIVTHWMPIPQLKGGRDE